MKKVFLLATLAVALVLTSCGNGVNKLPEDLRDIIKGMDKDFKEYFADEDEYEYKGVKVEDQDIVFTVQISKDELDGDNLKKWAKKEAKKDGKYYYDDMTKEQLQGYLMEKTFYDAMKDIEMDDEMKLAKELKKNKYNFIYRIIGENADDKVELKIAHKDLSDRNY